MERADDCMAEIILMTFCMACFVDWNSALMIIINGENDDHLEMLEGGVMRQLLDEKWKAFARVSKASAKVSSVF